MPRVIVSNIFQKPQQETLNVDDFSFSLLPNRVDRVIAQRRALASQLVAELAVRRLSKTEIGKGLRERSPVSDTYQALAQFVCFDTALNNQWQGRLTSRHSVAKVATKLSGLDFSKLAEARIHPCETGGLAIDTANMRCGAGTAVAPSLRLVALAEAYSIAREFGGGLDTREPADYSHIKNQLLPPLGDLSDLDHIFVA